MSGTKIIRGLNEAVAYERAKRVSPRMALVIWLSGVIVGIAISSIARLLYVPHI